MTPSSLVAAAAALLSLSPSVRGRIIDFERTAGAVPDNSALQVAWKNGALLNSTLAALQPGDVLLVPNRTYHVMGGIQASGLTGVTIMIDGTLMFSDNIDAWPRDHLGGVLECFQLSGLKNVTITSSGMGTLNGQGSTWWGFPGIGYLEREENRPRLLRLADASDVLVENLNFLASPYWTFWATGLNGLEVRNSHIMNRRTEFTGHGIIDLTAFNTDGFDVSGSNVWIHDSSVWTQDDCIAVKGSSENMLFERIEASGLGLTIGSTGGGEVVRNITFRDCYMKDTYKGIYMKFRSGGHISDVLFENIYMERPSQWAIWIGPAQQSDSRNLCAAHPCSICWPSMPFSTCSTVPGGIYTNITLRNVTIKSPKGSPGIIMADTAEGLIFDGVKVIDPATTWDPWGPKGDAYYACQGVKSGVATGNTWPVPSCFKDETSHQTHKIPEELNIIA